MRSRVGSVLASLLPLFPGGTVTGAEDGARHGLVLFKCPSRCVYFRSSIRSIVTSNDAHLLDDLEILCECDSIKLDL